MATKRTGKPRGRPKGSVKGLDNDPDRRALKLAWILLNNRAARYRTWYVFRGVARLSLGRFVFDEEALRAIRSKQTGVSAGTLRDSARVTRYARALRKLKQRPPIDPNWTLADLRDGDPLKAHATQGAYLLTHDAKLNSTEDQLIRTVAERLRRKYFRNLVEIERLCRTDIAKRRPLSEI